MKTILKICKSKDTEIKNLRVSEIDCKFQRDMSENLLSKAQALNTLYQAKVPRKFANAIVGLFGDPNAVANEQDKLFGKEGQEPQTENKQLQITANEKNDDNNSFQNINNKAINGA